MMPNADFEPLTVSQGDQTPAPRADLSASMAGNGLDIPAPADALPQPAEQPTTVNDANEGENPQPSTPLPTENTDEAERLARWVEMREMREENKYNRTVIISPLPDTVTVADVLPRIRGGVDSCYVSQFEDNRVAVVTFKLPADAITYVEFCAETPIWGLWTFRFSRPGVPFTWERRAEVQLFRAAPGIGSSWNRSDIPTQARTVVAAGSRCLVYEGCQPHEVAGIYRALGLHYSQHQRDQVEGMWLDGPQRDHKEGPMYGSLHIWYTSIRAAQDAKMRWNPLEYEYDPCSDPLPTLMLHLEEIEGTGVQIFRHHGLFNNLIDLHQTTIFNGVVQGIVDPSQAYWRCPAAFGHLKRPDEGASLTNRLQWSLQSHGGGMATPYQPAGAMPPPATQLSDPFIDSLPVGTGNVGTSMWYRDDRPTYYGIDFAPNRIPIELQPFGHGRTVPPGHFLSPAQTYVARIQERQTLGFPPYNNAGQPGGVPNTTTLPIRLLNDETKNTDGSGVVRAGFDGIRDKPGSSKNSSATNIKSNINNTNNHSNLGGNNNYPQSGRQPHPGSDDS